MHVAPVQVDPGGVHAVGRDKRKRRFERPEGGVTVAGPHPQEAELSRDASGQLRRDARLVERFRTQRQPVVDDPTLRLDVGKAQQDRGPDVRGVGAVQRLPEELTCPGVPTGVALLETTRMEVGGAQHPPIIA